MPNNQAIGRRRSAVARVRVMEGKSQMTVNGKPISEIFRGPIQQKKYQQPFEVTRTLSEYTATIKVVGGGVVSRLDAIVLGLARALSKISEENHKALRGAELLTRDPRVRERRKVGLGGRARAKKQSPKR